VVGRDEGRHGHGEAEHGQEKAGLVSTTGHVAARIAVNDAAEEGDHHPHQSGQPVDGGHAGNLPRAPEPDSGDEDGDARGEQRPHEPR
jgi:hypothetical protein